jgi:nucleotide-binding universal stress UspA family protein
MTGTTYGIVAGYDGSPGATHALRWAAHEALARDATLTVCLAWIPDHLGQPAESAQFELARQRGQEILTRGLPYPESVLEPGQVRADLAAGPAAQVLCEHSRAAEMVVVGSRGHGTLPGLRLGSVSWQLAGHASGRVVVVRGAWRPANQPPGPVVLGADGSEKAKAVCASCPVRTLAGPRVPGDALAGLSDPEVHLSRPRGCVVRHRRSLGGRG